MKKIIIQDDERVIAQSNEIKGNAFLIAMLGLSGLIAVKLWVFNADIFKLLPEILIIISSGLYIVIMSIKTGNLNVFKDLRVDLGKKNIYLAILAAICFTIIDCLRGKTQLEFVYILSDFILKLIWFLILDFVVYRYFYNKAKSKQEDIEKTLDDECNE